jgi:serine/threonine protein kinase
MWAFGCVLYELFALVPPFTATSLMLLVGRIVSGTYPPLPAHTPPAVAASIAALLSAEPADRPSASDLLQASWARAGLQAFLARTALLAAPSVGTGIASGAVKPLSALVAQHSSAMSAAAKLAPSQSPVRSSGTSAPSANGNGGGASEQDGARPGSRGGLLVLGSSGRQVGLPRARPGQPSAVPRTPATPARPGALLSMALPGAATRPLIVGTLAQQASSPSSPSRQASLAGPRRSNGAMWAFVMRLPR